MTYVRQDGAVVGAQSWDRARRFHNEMARQLHAEDNPGQSYLPTWTQSRRRDRAARLVELRRGRTHDASRTTRRHLAVMGAANNGVRTAARGVAGGRGGGRGMVFHQVGPATFRNHDDSPAHRAGCELCR